MGKNKMELKAELTRKSIHMLIALVPALAAVNLSYTALLLMTGVLIYIWAESMRFLGFSPPLVSPITITVLRSREYGRFVLAPLTLGLGALMALLLFPLPAAKVAIYALAFGDSASSLVGRFLGRLRPPFMAGKSVEGSLACLLLSALPAFFIFWDWKTALAVGIASMLADMLPIEEFDNLLMPIAAGLAVEIFQ